MNRPHVSPKSKAVDDKGDPSAGVDVDIPALASNLASVLGPQNVVTGDAARHQAMTPWGHLGAPAAIVRPASNDDIVAVLKIAQRSGVSVVPWGGRTGLVGGAAADGAVALSLERMRNVIAIDADGATMTVEAGCVLEEACRAASEAGLFFPVDLGARGSATIGGMIATNAGGNRVLRYGMMRENVLGLEAVLADGAIVSSLNRLIKNNAGFDLKHLFIGSEGTLGVVTRAVLRLRPKPISQETALLAVSAFSTLAPLLRRLESRLAGSLSAFEVMWPEFYDLVTTAPARGRAILPRGGAYYVLIEALGADLDADAARFEAVLAETLKDDGVDDAVIAKSQAERNEMWALRDDVAQTGRNGPAIAFDIGLPINEMDAYLGEVRCALALREPASMLVVFGHLGDGNLHLVVGLPEETSRPAIEHLVYEPLARHAGTVSAEHGIGVAKRAYLSYARSAEELALMRKLLAALNPDGLLNPGKVL